MRNKIKNSGFTLIELLVTTSIMVILLAVILVNFGSLGQKRNLTLAKNNLLSDLHKSQSYALSSHDISSGVQASSYGITFDLVNKSGSYTLIAEDNSATPVRYSLSTVNLPTNVYIKSVSVTRLNATNASATSLDVLFKVPFARVVQTFSGGGFSGTREANDTTVITLSTRDNASSATITIQGLTGNITP